MTLIRGLILTCALLPYYAVYPGATFLAKANPIVTLDNATVVGQPNGTVTKYLGLPFAQPP